MSRSGKAVANLSGKPIFQPQVATATDGSHGVENGSSHLTQAGTSPRSRTGPRSPEPHLRECMPIPLLQNSFPGRAQRSEGGMLSHRQSTRVIFLRLLLQCRILTPSAHLQGDLSYKPTRHRDIRVRENDSQQDGGAFFAGESSRKAADRSPRRRIALRVGALFRFQLCSASNPAHDG